MTKRTVRVLLVEDDHDDYVLTRDLLAEMTGQQYVLDWVSDYDAALKTMCGGEHDVYLLDYRLGLRTGLELLREAVAKNCKGAAIMLTGQGEREIDIAAMEAGAADYLGKRRLDGAQLERSIRYALQHKRHKEELEQRIEERTSELTRTNHFLNTLVKASPMAVVVVEPNPSVVRLWNPAAESLFGWTEAEVVNRVLPIVPEEKQAECAEHLKAIEQGRTVGAETYRRRKHGSNVEVSLAASPLHDAEGRLTGILLLFANITERKRSENDVQRLAANLSEADRRKDEFLAVLSHELRTPLTAIVGWISMLTAKELPSEKIAYGLQVIKRNVKVQTQLIEDLFDVSRIISGKFHLKMHPIELKDVSEAAIESVRHVLEAKQIELHTQLEPIRISGDQDRLQQVVLNLLSNAIKFTPRGGKVGLCVKHVDSRVDITVSDNGRGIDAQFLPLIFNRFEQADISTTRSFDGLGLGLAIVRHIVELHGGTVRAESAGEGKGAIFTIELPIQVFFEAEGEQTVSGHGSELHSNVELQGLRILVVDDVPDTRELLEMVLASHGATTASASSASEAMDRFKQQKPHVIISDIGMPLEDGYSLIRRIRVLPNDQGGNTLAIALTAFARDEDHKRALEAGFDAHIAKPINPEEFVASVAAVARGDFPAAFSLCKAGPPV